MKRVFTVIVISVICLMWLFLSMSCAQCTTCNSQPIDKFNAMCGPNCLLYVCEKFGVKTNLNQLKKLSNMNEYGTTFAGLSKAAAKYGIQSTGMKISLKELLNTSMPVIIYLWNNHFAVLESAGSNFMYIDSPNKPAEMAIEEIQPYYSGYALLLSKNGSTFPDSVISGPDMRLDKYSYHTNILFSGYIVETSIIINNVGDKELAISSARGNCGCITTDIKNTTIQPGAKGEIRVILDTKGLNGLQHKAVYIDSNDPVTPTAMYPIYFKVNPAGLAITKRRIDLGMIKSSDGASIDVGIFDNANDKLQVSCLSHSEYVSASIVKNGYNANENYIMNVAINKDAPIGHFRSAVVVYTNDKLEKRVQIPVEANIIGDITASPDSLFFDINKDGSVNSTHVTIRNNSKKTFRVKSIDSPYDYLSVDIVRGASGREYTLTGTIKGETPVGYTKGMLVVHTDDPEQLEVKIPVFVMTKD